MAGRPIDEKIVAMKMDNSDFKAKALETTSLFGKLKDSLSKITSVTLSKTAQELNSIKSAAANTDLSRLASSVDHIASKFSNLNVVATTALVNITNRAVDAGLALYKSLTVDPVMDGFREYESKIGSIGTMLANTEWAGSTLDDVKKTLGELNDYADNTIYSFEQMTQNIGRFTAAGVTLEDSAIAIKGLGNLAAVSGSDVNQLNTAMYQSSQALASGKLNLEDWNSLVNAGMAGKKTQDALVATARAMGKNVDLSDGFRNSIQDGWLTSKVFLATLKQFGEDESMTKAATSVRTFTGMIGALKEGIGSGWAETWELIFGDFEVATKRWTALSNVIGGFFQKSTHARNAFIKGLADVGIFDTVFKVVTGVGGSVLKVLNAIGEGFKKAFPAITIDNIVGIVNGFKAFTASLKPSEETLNRISTIFQAIGAVLYTVGLLAYRLGKALFDMIPPNLDNIILGVLSKIAEMVIAFTKGIQGGKDLGSSMSGLNGVFTLVGVGAAAMVKMFTNLGDAVSEVWSILGSGKLTGKGPWDEDSKIVSWLLSIRQASQSIGGFLGSIEFSLTPVANAFENLFESLRDGFNWIVDKLSAVGEAIKNALPSGNQLFAGGFIAGLVAVVGMAAKMAWDLWSMFTGWGGIGEGISDTLEGVSNALNGFATSLYANALLTAAIAIGILALSLKLLGTLDAERTTSALYGIMGAMMAIMGGLAVMQKYNITGAGTSSILAMIGMGAAVILMAMALKKLADLEPSEITKGVYGLIGIMAALSLAVVTMSKFGKGQVGASALQILAIAGAVHMMASAINRIAKIKTEDLKKGIIAMGIIILQMGLFFAMTKRTTFNVGSTLGMLAMGQAIINITNAIKEIAKIDDKALKRGLITIAAILVMIGAFTGLTSGMGLLGTGTGILLLSIALTALIAPILILGNTDWKVLALGLGAVAVALFAIAGASKVMGKTNMLVFGAGLIVVALGLSLLIAPIAALGSMSIGMLATGIIGLAVAIGVIGGAAALLGLAAAPLIMGAGAIALLGIALLAAGAGINLFASGLVILAGMTAAAVTTIVATLGTLLMGFASLIPMAVDFINKIIMQMATTAMANAPILADKFSQMMLKILEVMATYTPRFVDVVTKIITSFLDALTNNLPKIVESATNLVITLIESLAAAVEANGPRFLNAFMTLMAEVTIIMVQAGVMVIEALFGWIPGVTEATSAIGTTAEKTIRDTFKAKSAGEDKGTEFASALGGKAGEAKTAGTQVGTAGKLGADGISLVAAGGGAGSEFATALANKAGTAQTSGTSLANAGKTGAGSVEMSSTGSNFGLGFANGIDNDSVISKVASAARRIAGAAKGALEKWLDMHSPSREMMKDGNFFSEGFAIGIENKAKRVANSAKNLAVTAKDSMSQFLEGFDPTPEDNELHFKAVVDYDSLDPSKFGTMRPIPVRPDTSFTTGNASVARAQNRQNVDINSRGVMDEKGIRALISEIKEVVNDKLSTAKSSSSVVQLVVNERTLGEVLIDGIDSLQGNKIDTQLYMSGVRNR